MKVVISQPMYFPWVGMFEQIRQCDVFVNYDDVQFSKGSFTNHVQIKTLSKEGFSWLTVPLKKFKLGDHMNQIEVNNQLNWREDHIKQLSISYDKAPFKNEMIRIVENLFREEVDTIGVLAYRSMRVVLEYFEIAGTTQFVTSSTLPIKGSGSKRVFDIVKYFRGDSYITGHGAKNYLDHDLFELNGIDVRYMNYQRNSYPQLFGEFNPHVSILDLIANTGLEGKKYIISSTVNWKKFINES